MKADSVSILHLEIQISLDVFMWVREWQTMSVRATISNMQVGTSSASLDWKCRPRWGTNKLKNGHSAKMSRHKSINLIYAVKARDTYRHKLRGRKYGEQSAALLPRGEGRL